MFVGNNFFLRIISLVLWLVLVSFFIFTIFDTLPSDAATLLLGINVSEETLLATRAELGLNKPFFIRYTNWTIAILHGDLGTSQTYTIPINHLIAEKFPISFSLAILSLLLSSLLAIPCGLLMAWHYQSRFDKSTNFLFLLFLAIPSFWCAMIFVLYFAIKWSIFPAGGYDSSQPLTFLFLPALVLALPQIAIMGRFSKIQTLLILQKPFILSAFAKGCSQRQVLQNHVLKNIAAPILSLSGLQFAFLFSGAIIVENIFFLPGIGQFTVQALLQRDITSVRSLLLLFTTLLLCLNFLTDQLHRMIDPRPTKYRAIS